MKEDLRGHASRTPSVSSFKTSIMLTNGRFTRNWSCWDVNNALYSGLEHDAIHVGI